MAAAAQRQLIGKTVRADRTPARSASPGSVLAIARYHWLGLIGLALLLAIAAFAVAHPLITGIDPTEVHPERKLAPPGSDYLLGADQFGRDVAARLAMGAKLSLLVAAASVGFAMILGSGIGMIAGYVGGWWDEGLMRATDVILSFPYIVLAIALAAAVGSGLTNVILIVAVLRLPHFARLARGSVLVVKKLDYVLAARALGQRPSMLMWRHILPNSLSPLLVMAAVSAATAIIAEAALSFLGLGINPPTPSLGNMLSDAQQYVLASPGLAVSPGLLISLIVLGLNLVGDTLQELLDPRLRER